VYSPKFIAAKQTIPAIEINPWRLVGFGRDIISLKSVHRKFVAQQR
jgi:hypothetical protein